MTNLLAFAQAVASGEVEVVDLTHTLTPEFPTIVMPPELGQCAPFRVEEVSRYDERGPAWYWNNISMGEHTGTHFDAPVHWISGKDLPNNSVDTIAPDNFIAPAVVIDISRQSAENPDYELTVADVEAFEHEHGRIPPRNWVLLRTDWSKRTGRDYANMREDGQHSPGPCPEVVRFLVEERDLLGLGTETIGTDAGQAFHFNPPYPAHYYMHGKGRYGLQCLANLDRLPPTGAVILAAPLKIRRGSGSPLRVLALVPRHG
jgi:kynurenine formamidase